MRLEKFISTAIHVTYELIIIVATMLIVPNIALADAASCVGEPTAFDGIKPLEYATVTGRLGERIYIHKNFPGNCAPSKQETCPATEYVLPGDEMATAKKCEGWAYAQYIGKEKITIGWVASTSLSQIYPRTPAKPPVELNWEANGAAAAPARHYHFKITKGQGRPVCEAYLQRLNQTIFPSHPYCGRPESSTVPGFAYLQRRWIDTGKFIGVYPEVESFLHGGAKERYYVERKDSHGKNVLVPPTIDDKQFRGYVPSAWAYDPPVDIDNDGVPDNVVIWLDEDRDHPICGTYIGAGTSETANRIWRDGVILSSDFSKLNVERTKEIFGHPDGGFLLPIGPNGAVKLVPSFRSIGNSMGIIQYRGITYFDTFFQDGARGDFNDRRKHDKNLRNYLGVFQRRNDRTDEVCEYYVNDQGK